MRTILKATMIGLMAIAMGLLVTPEAKSGSGCGESTSAISANGEQAPPETNQDIIRLEELSSRIAGNISQLETLLAGMIDGMEEGRLRMELESVERVAVRLRSEIVDYQVFSLKALAAAGQTTSGGNENPVPASVTQEGCGH